MDRSPSGVRAVKHVRLTLSDDEYYMLLKVKGSLTWRELILKEYYKRELLLEYLDKICGLILDIKRNLELPNPPNTPNGKTTRSKKTRKVVQPE